ncbi:hypothetical protein RYR39_002504 [Yersinia ruckeri]|nr:hypothetical protein [Yersinia ruckeri]
MKSICLPVANAILRAYAAEMAELISHAANQRGVHSVKCRLHAREKEVITCNALAGLSMITSIAWQLGETESAVFHLLNHSVQEFRASGIPPQLFSESMGGQSK